MIAFLLQLIYSAFMLTAALLCAFAMWYWDKVKTVKTNPRSLLVVILIPLLMFFVYDRGKAMHDLATHKYRPYTEEEIAQLDPRKVERHIRLQERTQYINRQYNFRARLHREERHFANFLILLFTYSLERHRLDTYILIRHLESLYSTDKEAYERFIDEIQWMNKKEKAALRQKVQEEHEKRKVIPSS